jgi:TolB-like protein
MKKAIAASMLCLWIASIWAQPGSSRIPIAVPDFRVLSAEVSDSEVQAIQELLANALSNEPIFNVLERKQVTEMFNEVAFQVMTPGAMDTGISQKLLGARALLIGSVGKLYGRTVITTRLVDLETGLILFANNIYANDEEIAASLATLVNAIREKGFEMTEKPTEGDVAKQVKAKNYGESKRLADIYLRSNPDSPVIRAIYPDIVAGLADEYFRQAQGQLKRRLFDEARSKINQALALKVDERFYAFREKIDADEEEWKFRQAVLEARRKDELTRRAAGVTSGWDAMGSWYDDLDAEGAHLGAVYAPVVDMAELSVDLGDGVWGGEAFWLKAVGKDADPTRLLNWMAYAGGAVLYAPETTGASIVGNAYASPLSAQSARLGNLVLTVGLDVGGTFRYGGEPTADGENWSAAFTGGGLACLSVKAWKRMGLYLAAKANYSYYPDDSPRSGPSLRLSSGLSF